jgi:hypothetical protein
MPVKTGIQVKGMGMDPGFHRGDDKAWIPAPHRVRGKICAGMTEGESTSSRQFQNASA